MHRLILHSAKCFCSTSVLLCALIGPAVSQEKALRLDSSDWWSYTRREELPPPEHPLTVSFQNREPAESNFQIAGVTLGEPSDFSVIRSNLGQSTEVERGDAASSRNQLCYVSRSGSVHLIFEIGEVNSAAYLFEDGPGWQGRELCTSSNEVSENTSTVSGLRMGVTARQVKKILGYPNIDTPDKLAYFFGYKKKTTPEELAQIRQNYPDESDADVRKNFEYADVEVYIEARFASGKLNYLAISKSETQ